MFSEEFRGLRLTAFEAGALEVTGGRLVLRERPPRTCCHHPSVRQHRLVVVGDLRGGEERVDVALADPVFVVVALALDGDPGAVRGFGDEVDADVPSVEARQLVAVGLLRPAVDLRELELRFLQGDPHEELLEPEPLLRFVAGFGPDPGQGVADGRLSAHSDEIDHPFRLKSITHSG